jgi:hypothetical protein
MGTLLLVARCPRMVAPTRGAPGPCGAASGIRGNGCKSNNADLPAGISALAVPARQKLRPIGVAAAGCPALVTSVVRRAMLRGRLSRLSHGNRGGEEIAPISVSRNSVSCLPPSLAPRGLSRMQAAEYIGVGATKFDEMVGDGRMPGPKRIDGRTVWDRIKLDEAFDALDNEVAKSEWDRL